MPDALPHQPTHHGLDDLYDIARLADRLGVEHATIRVWLSRKVPWLPQPDGRLNGGAVWRAETLAGLEGRRQPGRPGPKPRAVAPVGPVTGGIPAISLMGGIPAVPTPAGAVPTATGAFPVVPAALPEGGD